MTGRWAYGAALAAALAGGAAYAQEAAPAAERVTFAPDYFAQFQPRTALDMVERVPGFAIDEGEERRGFAGAQGNVLIDGEAPAAKAQEIEAILARIPASDVERIELVRGASAGSAQALRVNVVRRAGRGSGVWSVDLARARDGEVTPSGELAYSGRWGAVEYGLSAALDAEYLPWRGEERAYNAAGGLDEVRFETLPTEEREARLAGEASFGLGSWRANVNAQLSEISAEETLRAETFEAGGALDETEIGDEDERERIGELGASLQREDGPWRTELTAVLTRGRLAADEASAEFDDLGALDEAAWQRQRVESGESVLHASLRRALGDDWSVTFGAEAALNTLEQRLSLVEDEGAGPAPVDLPSANVRVEEERAELSAMLAGALTALWSLEAGAAVEASRLTQSGDIAAQAELEYWKPSLQLAHAIGEESQVRLRLYRDVGQLDFEDFVSAADLENSVVDAGNPDLRPETSWRLEAAGDFRFGEDRALSVTLYRWAIEDALDVVAVGPPGDRFDAPGNIGDAELWGARVQVAWPLLWDLELRIDAMAQESEATDPLTGKQRALSERDESALLLELRQDLASFAWGVEYEREQETPAFRLDRIEDAQDGEELRVWVETSAFGPVKWRAWAENVSDDAETRDRRLFDPDRLGAFDGAAARARRAGVTVGISASGRF